VDFELSETQKLIRDSARTFAKNVVAPKARDTDRKEIFPAETYRHMGELGLLGVNVPAEYGGAGAGVISYALAVMEIAQACCSTAVGMCVTNMCAELITQFGTEAQKTRHVTRLVSGEAIAGAFALSEPHAGSDPGAGYTTAVKKGDTFLGAGVVRNTTTGSITGFVIDNPSYNELADQVWLKRLRVLQTSAGALTEEGN
jgi:alkylation response protein AidB-like acyl-CoA dehydrogenase